MNLVCFTGFGQKVGSVEEILVFQYFSQFQATCSSEMKQNLVIVWEAKRLLDSIHHDGVKKANSLQ